MKAPPERILTPTALSAMDIVCSVQIPPRPALLMALQREMAREDPHLKKIAELIRRDVAMAGSLLETSNSAFFNFSRPVSTVEDAMSLIGMNQCSAVMTGLITRKVLASGAMMMPRFWDVSEKRARAMSYMAKEMHVAPPDLAHSFGLFCDIGIPLLRVHFPAYLQTLAIANRTAGARFIEAEDARHGVNHVLIGALLAADWGIASDVVLAIRMHHAHEVLYDEAIPITARALVASNFVVEKAIQEHRGKAESEEWVEGGSAAAEALGLSSLDVREMCGQLKSRF